MNRSLNQVNKSRQQRQLGHAGFTMIELLITMVIAGILLAIAVPAMVRFLDTQAIRATCSTVTDAIAYARTEGIRRSAGGSNIVLLAPKCSNTFSAGWAVFQDDQTAPDQCYKPEDTLLKIFDAPTRGTTVTFNASTGSGSSAYLGFNGQGLSRAVNGNFIAGEFTCAIAGSDATEIKVVVNALGRVRQSSR